MSDKWCIDCNKMMTFRGVFDFNDWSFYAWECNDCGFKYTNLICPDCHEAVEYVSWPAVDQGTGEHLGDYEIWRCESCGWSGEKPLDDGTMK